MDPILDMLQLGLTLRQLPIIVHKHVNEDYLDLIASEEASRTTVMTVAEDGHFRRGGDELVLVFLAGLRAQLDKAVANEFVRGRPESGILVGNRTNEHVSAFGNRDVVGEGDVFFGYAGHVYLGGVSCAV